MIRAALTCSLLALLTSTGCGLAGSMNVEPVAVSTQKPGNVALFVAVSQHDQAVVGLDKQAFKVYENGVALDNSQIQLTLLPTNSAASQRVALLVDMSKSLNADDKKALSAALRSFIVRLRQREAVSLYAFDGTEKVHFVADYAKDARAEPDEKDTSMDRLLAFSRRDSSSSLYTAVMDGAHKLSSSLASEGRPIQSGTVIVVALNPDLAGRVNDEKVRQFVQDSPHHYFLMTVGPWATSADVSFLGKNGAARAASVNTMSSPLETVASSIDDDYFRNYLVSYCSPARAGTRELRLEVTTTDEQGKKSIGRYETEFDASGFGPGCSPLALPHFVLAKPNNGNGARLASNANTSANTKPSTKSAASAAKPAPAPTPESSEKVSSAATPAPKPVASAGAPAIAEPPSGMGYE
ncbi:MAG TPA: hypothetical protein VHV51_14070 [Polyangiaceae bacterium]|jgi:cell division septation protein DedD|nr:hypothetical protein [Polyangiaceae bacterium]